MDAKTELVLALESSNTVATREKGTLAFLKTNETGRPSVLFTFTATGGLTIGESKFVPIFSKDECIPSNAVEYFLYDSTDNTLEYYANGLSASLDNTLPAARSNFANGDRIFVVYAANEYAVEEVGSRPAGADATIVTAKYFTPISTVDVEDVGAVRQGQVELYLVDPDLVFTESLTGATIGNTDITFSGNIPSSVDLTTFVGIPFTIQSGPGVGGPAREIISATNNISGDFNNGTITLGGTDWASIRLTEDTAQVSTTSGVFVSDLCSVTEGYIGSDVTVAMSGGGTDTTTITGVDTVNRQLLLDPVLSGTPADGGEVFVDVTPTTDSTFLLGDYSLALRLQTATFSADLTREPLKEIGHLNPYARPVTLPIPFTVSIDTTASDFRNYAVFAGKVNKFDQGTLTDLDVADLFAKDNIAIVAQIYQQTDPEAGGNGIDRRVNSPDMFGDEYFVDGVRNIYTQTDGSLREYPVKTVIAQNLRINSEEYNLSLGDNATQTFEFRGTNELSVIRGFVGVDKAIKVIESQGE